MSDQHVAKLTEGEEDGEGECLVAVPELPRQEREARRDHERPQPVGRSS